MNPNYWAIGISITVAVTILIAMLGATLSFGVWKGKVDADRSNFNKFMDEVRRFMDEVRKDMAEVRKDMDEVRKDMDEVRKDMVEVRKDTDEVRKDIKQIFACLPDFAVSSDSPLRLTDLGEKISKDTDAKQWAETEAASLSGDIAGKRPFEIQKIAFDRAGAFIPSDELLIKMQDSAFKHGHEDLEIVRQVLGVELRDRLLDQSGYREDDPG